MGVKWSDVPGTPSYEWQVKSLMLVLGRANRYVDEHPEVRGIFPGKIRKKNKGYNETLPKGMYHGNSNA